jgi:hypothetical protein
MSGVGPKPSSTANVPDVTHLTLRSLDRILILDVFDVDAGTIHVPSLPLPNVTTAVLLLSLQLDVTLRLLLRRVPRSGFVIDAPCAGSRGSSVDVREKRAGFTRAYWLLVGWNNDTSWRVHQR